MSMKANELKVIDLMVGDWVMSFGAPHKIVGVRTDMLEPHIKTDMSDTWYEEGIEDLLEPIPLTPEILEKNGFENVDNMYPFPTFKSDDKENYLCITIGFPEGNKTKRKYPFIEIDSKDIYVEHIIINFVHQLQHALKLCGIDKEIVV